MNQHHSKRPGGIEAVTGFIGNKWREFFNKIDKKIDNVDIKAIKAKVEALAADNPVTLVAFVLLGTFVLVVLGIRIYFNLSSKADVDEFIGGIFVEAVGMLLDILVISLFLFWLQRQGERRLRIERYREEIEDYLPWKSEEATYRLCGLIRRLNKEGVGKVKLSGAFLKGVNLSKVNLSGANLSGADLSGADLSHADLSGASLYDADLRKAKLWTTNLGGANLSGVDLSGANLSFVDLSGADLSNTDLSGIGLSHTNLSGANLFHTNLNGANLFRAKLVGVKLIDPVSIYMDDEYFLGIGFGPYRREFNAYLRKANLKEAKLSGADLSNTDLRKVNFVNADLSGADLSHANLSGAKLSGADLSHADLRRAENLTAIKLLTAKTLYEAKIDENLLIEMKKTAPEKYNELMIKPVILIN